MRLAEALILRADKKKRIEQLRARLIRSAKVQEGEQPPESPMELINELNSLVDDLTILIRKINKTNSLTGFDQGQTLSDSLANRDMILLKRSVLESLLEATVMKLDRYSKSEVKFYSTVNIADTQKEIDLLSKQYRELDTKIQEKNWIVELIEN